ncbi:hypothetical protein J4E91_001185 [Alternaria rosae]|nr:hypothetical protein J4E91_001185 [Alternaria rosae]
MKRLVRIFRHVPTPGELGDERKEALYRKHTKEAIQGLPSWLRASRLSFGSINLCTTHKGLNQSLVNDMFRWIRHEFDGAIGKFLYPLVMTHGLLTPDQKFKVRQLEPVLQMWQPNFSLGASAPPGHEPVQCGTKWHYQTDQCPACMMARMGSDVDVLFALFAGMVGRFNSKAFTIMDAIRSADDLGFEMPERTIKPDDTMSPPTVRLPQRQTSDKRSAPFQIRRRLVPQPTVAGSTRGENSFLNPPDSTISRQSFATTAHTIASYTGGPSSRAGYIDPLDNPIYDHIETQEERVEKYRRLLSSHPDPDPFAEYEDDNASVFQKPQRQSMYSAFGDVGFDSARFDVIDEELAEDEIEDWERGEPEDEEAVQGSEVNVGMILDKGRYRRDSDASMRSNDFY